MCSNMGDTAATTFQLLYEVNEDVIMANVAWVIRYIHSHHQLRVRVVI